jgi:prepilin-type N-terminal cleavage/methylation domain-containing protein/prepilin-type processing-associated H-X9-DG protein
LPPSSVAARPAGALGRAPRAPQAGLSRPAHPATVAPVRPPTRPSPSPRAAFTLIELLVVIAIIAILAAIIFPVFARAREKARQASCLSNLKQLGSALQMYTDDHDGTYTRGQFWPFDGSHLWSQAIAPYVRNDAVFRCPTARDSDHSYGYNIAYWGGGDWVDGMHGINDMVPVTEYQVPTPAETLWLVDFGPYWGCGLDYDIQVPTLRHNDGANALFVDGHCKWQREFPARLWTLAED